jgi:hypothetical protein
MFSCGVQARFGRQVMGGSSASVTCASHDPRQWTLVRATLGSWQGLVFSRARGSQPAWYGAVTRSR